jgi:hypothetical protein
MRSWGYWALGHWWRRWWPPWRPRCQGCGERIRSRAWTVTEEVGEVWHAGCDFELWTDLGELTDHGDSVGSATAEDLERADSGAPATCEAHAARFARRHPRAGRVRLWDEGPGGGGSADGAW